MLLLVLGQQVAADITFSRTISIPNNLADVYLAFNTGCTSTDQYGSNNCDFKWGSSYTGTYNASLYEELTQGATVAVNMKLDSVIPLVINCAVCGVNCTFTVAGQDVSLPYEPCPIPVYTIPTATFVMDLPASNPLPATTASGTVVVTDQNGKVVISLTLTAAMQLASSESQMMKAMGMGNVVAAIEKAMAIAAMQK